MTETSDVLICGGGVIGLSCAFELAKAGRSVTVIDRGEPAREASWAGAGMLPPGAPHRIGDSVVSDSVVGDSVAADYSAMMRTSHDLWPEISADLKERTGLDNGFRKCGGLSVFAKKEDRDKSVLAWRAVDVHAEPLEPLALTGVEKQAASSAGHWHTVPTLWQVRNPRHLKALLVACRELNVNIVSGESAEGLLKSGPKVHGVRTHHEEFHAGETIIAAGAWSTPLLKGLTPDNSMAVRPVRGQIVLLNTDAPLTHILDDGPRYLVPRGDGRVLIGSTMEYVGFDKRTTSEGVRDLLELAARLCPALATASIEQTWAGLRPAAVRGRPLIGRIPGVDGLITATGHFRDGVNLSPITARVVAEIA